MKRNRSVSVLALTVLVAFSLKACSKEEYPIDSITLITSAAQVQFSLSGSEDIVIHWGDDGKKSTLNEGTFLDFAERFEFSHTYPFATSRKIIITGKVENLRCDNMQLTALDVSRNGELTALNCSGNQLTAIDVSRNTALTSLICSNNQLTDLDVSKNTALLELNLGGNQISAIDVSRNTALKYLGCSDTPLTNIDVSANTGLTILNLNRSQLTKLDVSTNTMMNSLCVRGNQLTVSALNDLFKTLFYVPEGEYAFIDYTENPGWRDADHSIWQEKNWMYNSCR